MSAHRVAATLIIAVTVVVLSTSVAIASFPMLANRAASQVYVPGQDKDLTLPRVIREVKPKYTAIAKEKKIQGTVLMKTVVLASGDVGTIEVIRSLDAHYGLDDQAVKAVRQWKFEPGRKDGKVVSIQVTIEMAFTLK
jgi:protein TonB